MSVKVCAMKPANTGQALAYGKCRASETLSVPATSTITLATGEYFLVLSTETSPVLMAVGSTPNASASSSTSATTAAMPLAPGVEKPVVGATGDKLAFAAFS